jgi:hypothetical protein
MVFAVEWERFIRDLIGVAFEERFSLRSPSARQA